MDFPKQPNQCLLVVIGGKRVLLSECFVNQTKINGREWIQEFGKI